MIKFENNVYDDVLIYVVNDSTSDSNSQQFLLFNNKVIENVINTENITKNDILLSSIHHLHDDFYYYEIMIVKQLKIKQLTFLISMQQTNFLTINDMEKLNQKAEKLFHEDGLYGIKDVGLIDHVLYEVKNSVVFDVDRYPTLIDKAAHLWYMFARYQAFHNGNKRTGMLAALTFLKTNFYKIETEHNLESDLYQVSKKVALEQMHEEDVVNFLLHHVKIDLTAMNNSNFINK